jgi:NADH-quinone oxidoreductase subunit E
VQGNSLATETLRGAQLAADRRWVAPVMPDKPPALPDLPEKK